jgi:hypothetical protein
MALAGTALGVAVKHGDAVLAWFRRDPNLPLAILEWIAAGMLIAKTWLAARSWRNITPARTLTYLLLWLAGASVLVTLAILLWAGGALTLALMAAFDFLPFDAIRLRNLAILAALLTIPLARIGCSPAALVRNRHR